MTPQTGGLPIRTAIVLLAAAGTAVVAGLLTYRETGRLGTALIVGGTALASATAYFDWLIQSQLGA